MAREVAEVRRYVDRGTREELAIANFWADGPSTPTPPGHWNFIALPYIRKAEFSEVRAARALALLNMALHDAAVGCWETKYFYFNPRPSHMDPELKSMIGLPNFPSYTSGHSTFSGAAAEVLSYLFPSGAAELRARRRRRPPSRGCMAAFTIGSTSRSARRTASGSEATPSALRGPTARTDGGPTVNPPPSSNVLNFVEPGRGRMSFLKRLLGRDEPPKTRVRICVECGMPVAEHKEWCSILRGQIEMQRRSEESSSLS